MVARPILGPTTAALHPPKQCLGREAFATLEAQNPNALPRLMLITVRSVFGVIQYVFMETNGPCR